ncbi:MAG TPA: DUF4386 domain-containing protein, partial [Flavobacterium sp.]|nr:DUF4386 domain-containing protein [Flavobacterium sp.]
MKHLTFTIERRMALIAGLSLVIMAAIAGIAYGGMFQKLYIVDDANATLTNLTGSSSLFRLFILLFLIVLILDLIVAWALYVFFKHVNEPLSLLSALFRLMYCALFGVSFLSLISVQHQLNDAPQNVG